jgi:hypothetical protein
MHVVPERLKADPVWEFDDDSGCEKRTLEEFAILKASVTVMDESDGAGAVDTPEDVC